MGDTDLRVANRAAATFGIVLLAIGGLCALAWTVELWNAEQEVGPGGILYRSSLVDAGPSFADRVTAGAQTTLTLGLALLVMGAGAGLVLAGKHLPDRRRAPVEPHPLPPVIEVPLEVEERFWGSVGPRPDEDPLRP
ncbi:MAG: hypothetical protein ACXWA3_04450 [Acidimicrobiales bacterium]